MIGHDDETDAASIELEQFISQDTEQNSLRLIVIEQPATVSAVFLESESKDRRDS